MKKSIVLLTFTLKRKQINEICNNTSAWQIMKRLANTALGQALLKVYVSLALVPFPHLMLLLKRRRRSVNFNWTENEEDIIFCLDTTLENLFNTRYATYSLLLSLRLQCSCYFACDLSKRV